ncbi:TetR/AcrR family transcriptional regulator [Haliangium sp.]|uniref:TetR/AcrR family transcriptional regulator n=1 Tax=Haliangium sp. TaxID=2663208 RepID=UPI003D0D04C8
MSRRKKSTGGSPGRARKPSSAATGSARERLLDAARDVVAASGWNAATSRVLADHAGLNLALINYHFGGKDALLLAALERSMVGLAEQLTVEPDQLDLARLGEDAMRFTAEHARSADVQMLFAATLQAPHDATVAATVKVHLDAFRAHVTRCVEQSVAAGQLGSDTDVGALGAAIAAMFDGALLHALIDPGLDLNTAIAAAIRGWLRRG